MTPLRVFIGYDPRQPLAYQVAAHSVVRHASVPVSITPLMLNQLPITRRGLTDFTFSRFLVPYLSGYEGVSLFVDSDILCRADITDLLAYPLAWPATPVFVVQHRQRFEWPSVMVFNNALCQTLTPDYVQDAVNNLFAFDWAECVGPLPPTWNHLVGYGVPNTEAKLVHFTKGIPCWAETAFCEYAHEWNQELKQSVATCSFRELMGNSVHVAAV